MIERKFRVRPGQSVTFNDDDIIRLSLEDGLISIAKLSPNEDVLTYIHTDETQRK